MTKILVRFQFTCMQSDSEAHREGRVCVIMGAPSADSGTMTRRRRERSESPALGLDQRFFSSQASAWLERGPVALNAPFVDFEQWERVIILKKSSLLCQGLLESSFLWCGLCFLKPLFSLGYALGNCRKSVTCELPAWASIGGQVRSLASWPWACLRRLVHTCTVPRRACVDWASPLV